VKYLLDTMVVKEIGKSKPHQNVEAWLATVDDPDLAISVINVREIWKGIEKKRANNPVLADTLERDHPGRNAGRV
jgi:toxin FitB